MNERIQFVVGLVLALAGAALRIDGSFLGENTAEIGTVTGIMGILLIGTSKFRLLR